ncbi:hypothetical protein OS493_033763 [Desmophyllum pertusum]|uniref:Uncharacterized protein n=1 Tax=Desmophyllum pertusum TaxID=174260 RepID=A0A9X0CUL2_9CNID|nr:hypothetical protein OS493_033763 [Desmophyllum pertusum]
MAREETSGKVQRRAINSYPKGIWTRDENVETKHLDDNNDPGDCPPGMWASAHVQLESDPRLSRKPKLLLRLRKNMFKEETSPMQTSAITSHKNISPRDEVNEH